MPGRVSPVSNNLATEDSVGRYFNPGRGARGGHLSQSSANLPCMVHSSGVAIPAPSIGPLSVLDVVRRKTETLSVPPGGGGGGRQSFLPGR
jgi:hypothetical protein